MSNWERIDYSPYNGLSKWVGDHPDDPDGVLIKYTQDPRAVAATINQNKELANHHNTGRMGDFEHAASIPISVMFEWKKRFGVDAWKYGACEETRKRVNALLNDSEWRYLKCRNIII